MPKWPKDLTRGQEALYKWGGKWFGVPFDHDGQVLYYRKDILNDPKWKEAFKKEVGYDMPVPPETLDQLYDISNFLVTFKSYGILLILLNIELS
jgi:multiple sugar transport system substrate-binding protein